MPIILICSESKNTTIGDFRTMDLCVDILLESTHPDCTRIGDYVVDSATVIQRIAMNKLEPRKDDETDEDVRKRVRDAIAFIRQLNVRVGMIISHHSVLNSLEETLIHEEWDLIGM